MADYLHAARANTLYDGLPRMWLAADGRVLSVTAMSDQHLVHAANMCLRTSYRRQSRDFRLTPLLVEVRKRGLLVENGSPYIVVPFDG